MNVIVNVWSPSTTMQTATGSLSHPESVFLRVSVSHLHPLSCLEFPVEARPPSIAADFITVHATPHDGHTRGINCSWKWHAV